MNTEIVLNPNDN